MQLQVSLFDMSSGQMCTRRAATRTQGCLSTSLQARLTLVYHFRETLCESGRWIDVLKKWGRVLKKRGGLLRRGGGS